ncbi:MAG: hypothetical protein ACK4E8_09235 [Lacibacter sp.]|jgi:hypothetical protein
MRTIIRCCVLLFLLAACSPTRLTSVWKDPAYNPEPFQNIMVVGLLDGVKNRALRACFENHMAEDFQKMGYNAMGATAKYGPRRF